MKTLRENNRFKEQKGSALFIILVAIVLFVALSYTVAEMFRGGNANIISDEKSKLQADEILNYARSLRQATQNLKISNGCSESDISFENQYVLGYEHAPPVANKCKIFNDAGGGVVYLRPVAEWLDLNYATTSPLRGDWFFPGKVCVPGVGNAPTGLGCNADGVDNEAIIAVLPYIKQNICIAINNALGVDNPAGTPPVENGGAWMNDDSKFLGPQTDGERLDQSGQSAGCFEGAPGSSPPSKSYHFFQVLVPR